MADKTSDKAGIENVNSPGRVVRLVLKSYYVANESTGREPQPIDWSAARTAPSD